MVFIFIFMQSFSRNDHVIIKKSHDKIEEMQSLDRNVVEEYYWEEIFLRQENILKYLKVLKAEAPVGIRAKEFSWHLTEYIITIQIDSSLHADDHVRKLLMHAKSIKTEKDGSITAALDIESYITVLRGF